MDLLIPGLGQGASNALGTEELRAVLNCIKIQGILSREGSSLFPWVQEGLKKEWEFLKSWPGPTMGFGSSILAGTGH